MSDCVNDNVVDVQGAWRHNGFGLASNPDVLASLAAQAGADVSDAALLYFTAYDRELESDGWKFDPSGWRMRSPVTSAAVTDDVRLPASSALILLGYDVVVFGDFLEHSPLSCNSIAKELPVNEHCCLRAWTKLLQPLMQERLETAARMGSIRSSGFTGCNERCGAKVGFPPKADVPLSPNSEPALRRL
ncbi:hypothetical protein [Sphingomonas sp. MA1305]|uniref:hypothetical protein n=1 Tax=Sphingomonas sp. MA1305 TaxID=2479204 RepID=UPI0018DF9847|nr:hypothetical protein [Sphingomonas sp. MA1305]